MQLPCCPGKQGELSENCLQNLRNDLMAESVFDVVWVTLNETSEVPPSTMPTPVLENPEHQTKWYSRYFLGKFHRNYVGQDATDAKSIYALSGR